MAADGRIESFNSGAERLLKVPAATVIGRQVDEVLPDLGLGEVLKTGKVSQRQSRNLGVSCIPIKDGTEVVGAVAAVNEIPQYGQFGRGPWFDKNKNEFRAKYRLEDIIGNSVAIVEAKTLARRFAASDNTVLIYGPSGSGKEMFAQGIHNASARMAKPFVAINCAALPVTLLESELFGYDEGAFTGARRKGKAGLFELAAGGTVFLDEIDAMPIELQGRLLRVVQEREIIRVGGETVIPVDIRVIAATNKVPHELVSANKLREDLYYRLNVLYLELPSLAARREDIPLLCQSFLTSAQYEQLYPLLTKVLAQLQHYTWPGNVRELQNFCQRLWFYWEAAGETDDIPRLLSKLVPNMAAGVKTVPDNLHSMVASYEQDVIRRVVAETGSIRKAAKILGVGKSTIARKLKRQ